jgi:16S rRNA (adenine(1408)-N(1))-methyltransferase
VAGEPAICAGLRAVARAGGLLEVTVGTSIWREPVPLEVAGLPELTAGHVAAVLAPRLAETGWQVTAFGLVTSSGIEAVRSSWARRLAASPRELVAHLQATAG